MSKRRIAPLTFLRRLLLRILAALAVFWGGGIALFSVVPVPFSAVMAERQISAWLSGEFGYVAHSDWVSMADISPWMGLAVIAAEDQKFPEHWGFDVPAIEKRWRIMSGMRAVFAALYAFAANGEKSLFMGWTQLGAQRSGGWANAGH